MQAPLTQWPRYRHFIEGDLYRVRDIVHLGGALELDVAGSLPLVRIISFKSGLILGGDVSGSAFGIGLSF